MNENAAATTAALCLDPESLQQRSPDSVPRLTAVVFKSLHRAFLLQLTNAVLSQSLAIQYFSGTGSTSSGSYFRQTSVAESAIYNASQQLVACPKAINDDENTITPAYLFRRLQCVGVFTDFGLLHVRYMSIIEETQLQHTKTEQQRERDIGVLQCVW